MDHVAGVVWLTWKLEAPTRLLNRSLKLAGQEERGVSRDTVRSRAAAPIYREYGISRQLPSVPRYSSLLGSVQL